MNDSKIKAPAGRRQRSLTDASGKRRVGPFSIFFKSQSHTAESPPPVSAFIAPEDVLFETDRDLGPFSNPLFDGASADEPRSPVQTHARHSSLDARKPKGSRPVLSINNLGVNTSGASPVSPTTSSNAAKDPVYAMFRRSVMDRLRNVPDFAIDPTGPRFSAR